MDDTKNYIKEIKVNTHITIDNAYKSIQKIYNKLSPEDKKKININIIKRTNSQILYEINHITEKNK